jgi:glycine/D-amino acid oxidase-like deaminating enzyme
MSKHGFPFIGLAGNYPNLYIAVTHGVTLASILGELVTQELLDGVSVAMLEPYRLSRFHEQLERRSFAPEGQRALL